MYNLPTKNLLRKLLPKVIANVAQYLHLSYKGHCQCDGLASNIMISVSSCMTFRTSTLSLTINVKYKCDLLMV
jgi:hypothetical protein